MLQFRGLPELTHPARDFSPFSPSHACYETLPHLTLLACCSRFAVHAAFGAGHLCKQRGGGRPVDGRTATTLDADAGAGADHRQSVAAGRAAGRSRGAGQHGLEAVPRKHQPLRHAFERDGRACHAWSSSATYAVLDGSMPVPDSAPGSTIWATSSAFVPEPTWATSSCSSTIVRPCAAPRCRSTGKCLIWNRANGAWWAA